ncbi:PLP-dependent aminotransferase family protein [Luteolibacter ambystomatis]|uniref:PLP-dependent aminotransferase family protein n=1 Tax=Luteolibacter ambystomatis TaxID=2824561 RepID=A0A975PGS8_9BACT|nr:PLP-dependent aminotransferase family protein [Luteolibacter ambystomatis]QUE52885.1 PLP-dependent aminotransferase family protein [Luteolibacter ambystomatis]
MSTSTEQPLYLRIADRLENMIQAGTLRAGDRIPSVRQFGQQQGVSVPTVMQAYTLLESRRLIEARPKSGFYVTARLAKSLVEPSLPRHKPTRASLEGLSSVFNAVRDTNDPRLVPLGSAVPSDDLVPLEKLARASASIVRRNPAATFRYDPAPGSPALRKELSRRSIDWGCAFEPDDFIVTVGASEALHLALMAVTKPGDTVLVESPGYYGTLSLLAKLKLNVVPVPACICGLELNAVREAVKKYDVAAMLVIPNFSNPAGGFMSESNRRTLLQIADEHDIPIVEDDIYGDLPHQGPRPPCLKALDRSGRVLLCGSYSKTLAPGLRVGYLVGGRHHDQLMELKNTLNLGGPALSAMTVAEFLRSGGYDRHLRKLREAYRLQTCRTREKVAETFPEGTRVSNPEGGLVLWLELPEQVDVLDVYREARAAGINFAPGTLFSPQGLFRNCLRLSCGNPWTPRIEEGIATLGAIARKHAEP